MGAFHTADGEYHRLRPAAGIITSQGYAWLFPNQNDYNVGAFSPSDYRYGEPRAPGALKLIYSTISAGAWRSLCAGGQ